MIDYKYNNKIETDVDKSIVQPLILLTTRSGKKIDIIRNVQNLRMNHPMNDTAEISFDVYKYVDGKKELCWDSIKNFKFICLPTVSDNKYKWYEITVNIDETTDTIKHVTGLHANEAELGQLELYEVEINTEGDIDRDDYETITIDGKEYGTVFYCPEHPKNSLLHRILSDKASHYQVIHVDETLKNIQREFSFNGTSIADALRQTIAQEIQCLFVFGRSLNGEETNEYQRTISVYDLLDYCEDCGERGTYSQGVCTHCGSTNIKSGYGEDSGIFINTDNLTDSISFTSATDQVKNFFKLSAGDEDMTAAIRNCNPSGSAYLCYFSDEMKEDMSDELVQRLNEYNTAYDSYSKTEPITLPSNDIDAYNTLVNTYQEYSRDELIELDSTVYGFAMLTNYDYNSVNFRDFLQTTMMPYSEEVVDTTAQDEIDKLTGQGAMSPIGVEDASAMSLISADTAVKDYAKVYVNTALYKIEVSNSSYSNNTWSGTITVTSYIDEDDTANTTMNITFNNDGATFMRQKIDKALAQHKAEDIGDVSFLSRDSLQEFEEDLEKYSLDSLNLLDEICTSIMDILAQAGYGENSHRYYSEFYYPYVQKKELIMAEETKRESEIKTVEKVIKDIDEVRSEIIDYLNMESFFGDLYSELMLYRRETEYSNPNFISDGLTDSEIIERAQDFFKRAQEEIIKASTVQHTISGNIYNLFLIPEFRQVIDSNNSLISDNYFDNTAVKRFLRKFESGNWLRIQVDDKIYKLRMTNWEIDYESPEELTIEFSDVVYGNETVSDIQSLLSQARSMASSYNTVARQANKGGKASKSIDETKKRGLMLSQNKIIDDINEQSFVIDSNGALMRGRNDFDEGYNNEQLKILNKGIYYTNDNWETVKAGLGHFMYYDPENGVTEDYGIIASTVVGQLFLGKNLKIYSESSKLEMGNDGLVITADYDSDNSNLFVIRKDTGTTDASQNPIYEKYIYVDSNGNLKISGSSVIVSGNDTYQMDDARKVATNYLSVDNSGIMVADTINPQNNLNYTPSDIPSGKKNVLITANDLEVRDGQTVLASYGNDVVIGKTDESNIKVANDTISGNKYGVIRYVGNEPVYGNIETFSIFVGAGETIEDESSEIYKISGDTVSYQFTPTYASGNNEPFQVYAEIYLVDESIITSQRSTFNTNPTHTEVITSEDIELPNQQLLTVGMYYNKTNNSASVTIDDSGCTDSNYKVNYIKVFTLYNNGEIYYPHYRFGVRENQNNIDGKYSFDIGENNATSGNYSFVHGVENESRGDYSFVSGIGNVARYDNQTVVGKYAPLTSSDDLLLIGNGTSGSNRSYAMRLKNNGRAEFGGAVGTGLAWDSRSQMIDIMQNLSLNKPYNFYASSTDSSGSTIFWGTTAGASASDAFGTICRIDRTRWHMMFMCGGSLYKSIFTWDGSTSGSFVTTLIG